MDIFLVRVSERTDGSLYIERKASATTRNDYIAISHVWGSPETISHIPIDGIEGLVALSPGKRDILNIVRRREICGTSWFWMDLFCIDQNPDAAISIAQQLAAISAIYKSSSCVKVLIESPTCEVWQSKAANIVFQGSFDEEIFSEEELRHSRRCPHMPFLDPWFERLWTRQEGLYGMYIDMIMLNPVPCARLQSGHHSAQSRWLSEGAVRDKRATAELFIEDKLTYHGFTKQEAEEMTFQVYLDLFYRRRMVIESYGGRVGPHTSYSPIAGAWSSTRITTKTRDYFLAVFPDVAGYTMPDNPRKMSFDALLADALIQDAVQQHFSIATKVPKGMLLAESSDGQSASPWIPQQPTNVAEALDGFLGPARLDPRTADDSKFFTVNSCITFETISPSKESLPRILESWTSTADVVRHINQIHPSGPCAGSKKHGVPVEEIPLGQYLTQQFTLPAWRTLGHSASQRVGALSLEYVKGTVSDEVFARNFREFLVCLICGTTLGTANVILQSAHLVLVHASYGKLLALVNIDERVFSPSEDIALLATTAWQRQGLTLAVRRSPGKYRAVGRTVVPCKECWESL